MISFVPFYNLYAGGPRDARRVSSVELLIDFNNPYKNYYVGLFDNDYFKNQEIGHKILNYFYPNGTELFAQYVEGGFCFEYESFPESFRSNISAVNREVIFSIDYPHSMAGPCADSIMIAIPISDILEQIPELVPADSVIRRL